MNQPELFDPGRLAATPCPVPGCGAIRTAGQHKVPTCRIDQQRATEGWTPRPKPCLNVLRPEHAEIPY